MAPIATDPGQSQPVSRKGHVLKLLPGNGFFCVKCGKKQSLKHQTLKITNKPYKFAQLPQAQWLSSPGAFQNVHRIQTALHELTTVHNKGNHSLVWNEKCGKDRKKPDHFGKKWCKLCNREWPWMHRHANMSKTKCKPDTMPFDPPEWVKQMQKRSENIVTSKTKQPQLRFRLLVNRQQVSRQQIVQF